MTVSYTVATSEMFGVIATAWVDVATLVGYPPELRWQDLGAETAPDSSKIWGRASRQTLDASQTSLSACVGQIGQSRYTELGLLYVQLFGPLADDAAHRLLPQVAEIIRGALRRKSTGESVWFRNARIDDGLPPENRLLRLNVVATFNYDEIF